jgi:murein DD-endopeptidase MepM/ murein hydrolase activator NlpD
MAYYEPIKGSGAERRDELGNFASYRSQPHRGSDWGFTTGSAGKPITAIRSGVVAKVFATDQLGHSVIIRSFNDGVFIEYNHLQEASPLKRGETVEGGKTVIGKIGDTGTASTGAHLHASAAKAPIPHAASRPALMDLFKLIDADKPPVAKKPVAKKTK